MKSRKAWPGQKFNTIIGFKRGKVEAKKKEGIAFPAVLPSSQRRHVTDDPKVLVLTERQNVVFNGSCQQAVGKFVDDDGFALLYRRIADYGLILGEMTDGMRTH